MVHPCPGKEKKYHLGVSSIEPNSLLQVITIMLGGSSKVLQLPGGFLLASWDA
jgi:hypothetical protein